MPSATDYVKKIGHVVGSTYYFLAEADRQGIVDLSFLESVQHCMLSHHGRKEWGSPVEPATKEAWLLHAADMLSSRNGERR